ncbi:TlpA family protein disulfide reductase [Maribacter sp. ANRC-HE7]|uniref:TlpA family protein disulfide reductase n=1 Tax=Maribacter aquimaris TaxID=2737171 RepID=A0ABR7V4D1_9FLAO|nr:TlpA disulfide reductase family protein [Maribacter aquimaris]MBD0778008.1 TlpA family protein disulfide reductase [Maribacter aquimaris]
MKYLRKTLILITFLTVLLTRAQEHTFSQAALNDSLVSLIGDKVTFDSLIKAHKGKTILLDIWASWCKDCVVGMPTVKKLKEEFPEIAFVYISLDRNAASWKKGIKRFGISNGSHFWASEGWKSDLFKDIDLDWIPRYMVLDAQGNIKLYKAIKASDKEIVKQLRKSKS